MRYITPEYSKQLDDLAETLVLRRTGDAALADTVEFSLVDANQDYPPRLRLCDPPEAGWQPNPPEAA